MANIFLSIRPAAIKANCMRAWLAGAVSVGEGAGKSKSLACCFPGDLYLIVVIMVIRKRVKFLEDLAQLRHWHDGVPQLLAGILRVFRGSTC